jgi:hypothetical protein
MTDNNNNNKTPNQSVRTGQSFSKSISKKPPNNNYATKEQSIQEPTMKFHPFQPGRPSQRYGSYSKVKEQALLYIQSNFKDGHDIAKSLRDEQLVDLSNEMPKPQTSTKKDNNQHEAEQKMFDMITKGEVEKYLTRKDNLCQNQPKAFSVIMQDFCTPDMTREIQTHPDFKSKIEDNPFELLKVVKTLMHNPTRARYPFLQLTDIALSFLLCRQYENEHPANFKKRLEEKADIFASLVGNNILDEFVKTTPAHKQANSATKEQLRKKAMDQWIALIAIRNSEPTKYSILKRNLNDDYSMGVDKFPTDLDSTVDILINHNKFFTRPRPPPGKPSPALKSKTTEDDIPTHEGATTSFAQCFKCGSHDHLGPDCKQTKPADEWYATKAMKHYEEQTEKEKKEKDNKEQQHMTIQQTDQLADDPEPTDNVWSSITMTQFNGCQIQEQPTNSNNNKYKDLIVLDSTANVDVFNNPQLVNNIKIAPSPIKVGTNNGTKSLNLTAQSRGRNSAVWFDSTAPTNTYSLAALKKDKTVNKIVFDSSKEDAFIVHLKNGRKVKFHCTPEGLYAYGPNNKFHNNPYRALFS